MVSGHGHPYGYTRPLSRYMDIRTDIRADIHVELSVLRTVQPAGYENLLNSQDVGCDYPEIYSHKIFIKSCVNC